MPTNREVQLEKLLFSLIEDFDQIGCSVGMGTVLTSSINEARSFLGMDLLEDLPSEDEEGPDESASDQPDRCIDCDVSFEDYPEMKTGGPKCTTCSGHPKDDSTP